MPNIADLHSRALHATRKVVADVRPDQLTAPTPCEGWDVEALLNHLVSGNLWAAELAFGKTIDDVGGRLDGDVLGGNVLGAYDGSAGAAAEAFNAPGALDAPCAVSYGPVPGSVYAGHRFIDVFVHGWDLAVGIGADATLDPELVDACLEVVEPQVGMLRASGMFGEDLVAPGSDAQTRLLGMLGRHT